MCFQNGEKVVGGYPTPKFRFWDIDHPVFSQPIALFLPTYHYR